MPPTSSRFDIEWVAEHSNAMRRLARALLADESLADDVVQDTLLSALERPPGYSAGLRAWFRKAIKHRALDLLRAGERRARHESAAARTERVMVDDAAVEGLALQRSVLEAVNELREPYRTVVYLRYFEHLPPRAIAARLGTPVKTVKTQLWRALEMLRRRLDSEHQDRQRWTAMLVPIAAGRGESVAGSSSFSDPFSGVVAMKAKNAAALAICVLILAVSTLVGIQIAAVVEPGTPTEPATGELSARASREPGDSRSGTDDQLGRVLADGSQARTDGRAETGSLLITCVWSDGSPAAGVQVVVEPLDLLVLGAGKQWFASGADGRILVPELSPGRVSVDCDRTSTAEAAIAAGMQEEVLLRMDRGVDVRGVVVDVAGRPVPGASIWRAGQQHDWSAGYPIALSDAEGRFMLRSIGRRDSLWASAPERTPSSLVDLEGFEATRSEVELELVLGAGGAVVRGRVLDSDSRAVAGARVTLGVRAPRVIESRVDGSLIETRTPRTVTTDEGGGFAFEGVGEGTHAVAASADGWPVWRGEVSVGAVPDCVLDIRLAARATVAGIVSDELGTPVEGAVVLALPARFRGSVPGRGFVENRLAFPYPGTRTNGQGEFELPPLAAGEVHLYAAKGERSWRHRGEPASKFVGVARATMFLRAGEVAEWQPRLSRGAEIRGRVTHADGSPMPRVFVTARNSRTGIESTVMASEEGLFTIVNLSLDAHRVAVVQRGAPRGTRPLVRDDVRPGGPPIELVAGFSTGDLAKGVVRIKFSDVHRRVEKEPAIVFVNERNWFRAERVGDEYVAELRPGRYRPVAMSGNTEVGEGPWFDVARGDELDVGLLLSSPGGDLVVRLDRADAGECDVELMVLAAGSLPARTKEVHVMKGGAVELRFSGLNAGPAKVSLWGDHCLVEQREVTIVAGATVDANLLLRRAAKRVVEFSSEATGPWGAFELTIRDAGGEIVRTIRRRSSPPASRVLRLAPVLPLGEFRFEAATSSGLKAAGVLRFGSFEVDLVAPRFTLR